MNRFALTLSTALILNASACQAPISRPISISTTAPTSSPLPSASSSPLSSPQPSASPSALLQTAPNPPQNGLIAYYAFEGNADSHDHKHDGRIIGSTTFDEGIKGKSIYFVPSPIQGVGVHLSTGSEIQLRKAFTISIWSKTALEFNEVRRTSLPLVCTSDSGGIDRFGMMWTMGGADIFLNKNSSNELWLHREKKAKPEIQAFEWHHTVLSYDGQQLKIHLDGKLDHIETYSSSSEEHGTIREFGLCTAVISTQDPTRFSTYEGFMDEIRIYSRALNDLEAQAIYQFDRKDS